MLAIVAMVVIAAVYVIVGSSLWVPVVQLVVFPLLAFMYWRAPAFPGGDLVLVGIAGLLLTQPAQWMFGLGQPLHPAILMLAAFGLCACIFSIWKGNKRLQEAERHSTPLGDNEGCEPT